MAYFEKYYITFCDRYGDAHRVSIEQKDFIGTSIELEAQEQPILITYKSEDEFKFSPIRSSSAEINMAFGTDNGVDFQELWTADEKEFKIVYTKEGLVEWTGFVIPDGFSYEFKGGVYYAIINANDGLKTLEDIVFKDVENKPYGQSDLTYNNGFEFPFVLILTEILRKLDLSLDLWVCADVYEKSMTKTGNSRNGDPLAQSYVNVKTFIGDSDKRELAYWRNPDLVMNCKEVLENVCYIFGAKIYQCRGVWRFKRINADANYGSGDTQRYWRRYNPLCVYLPNYLPINDLREIPCYSLEKAMIGDDHVLRMDDVYAAFRMNYEYTFIREGDSPINLLTNADFSNFPNDIKLASPIGWVRWRYSNKWYARLKDIIIPSTDAGGFTTGIEFGTQKAGLGTSNTDPNSAIWASLKAEGTTSVNKGDLLNFSMWLKYRQLSSDQRVYYYPFFKMVLECTNGDVYYLRNTYLNSEFKFIWQKIDNKTKTNYNLVYDARFFYFLGTDSPEYVGAQIRDYKWYSFNYNIQPAPEAGELQFHIHGIAANQGRDSDNFPSPKAWFSNGSSSGTESLSNKLRVVRENWGIGTNKVPWLQITGVFLGRIPNENELPQSRDYIYNNTTGNYSLKVDPITILNGDTQDVTHISNIIVPSNTTGLKNFWNTIDEKYDASSLGLITVKSVMNLYYKPFKILEGTVRLRDIYFDGVYRFEALADTSFILQSVTLNPKDAYLEDAIFTEINNNAIPSGGTEAGETLDPEWVSNGVTYCQKNGLGVNTGFLVVVEEDINPNSETYGETREIISEAISDSCSLGTPWEYYFGADDLILNEENLATYPIEILSSNEVQVNFNNNGGLYLYFIHLASKGLVERIYTNTQTGNIISDWNYLSDITINGYLYRVLRTDYVMGEFTNYTHNFKFS